MNNSTAMNTTTDTTSLSYTALLALAKTDWMAALDEGERRLDNAPLRDTATRRKAELVIKHARAARRVARAAAGLNS